MRWIEFKVSERSYSSLPAILLAVLLGLIFGLFILMLTAVGMVLGVTGMFVHWLTRVLRDKSQTRSIGAFRRDPFLDATGEGRDGEAEPIHSSGKASPSRESRTSASPASGAGTTIEMEKDASGQWHEG